MRAVSKLNRFLLKPMQSGLLGLILFFSLILLMKVLSSWIYGDERVSVETDDFLLSLVGFVLLFFVQFLSNFNSDRQLPE
ncbi:MAG: hypothetical protein FJ214_03985 [Ignavibacteria bacterium]|nr:hypothetical protein [Ignavibacteria bacterium]